MTRPFIRSLGDVVTTTTTIHPPPPDSTTSPVESDFVVILAALLCALICVLGLIAVARCTWLRRFSSPSDHPPPPPAPPSSANKGVKKKILKSLPKLTYREYNSAGTTTAAAVKLSECAICLAEFVSDDEIRVLPQCHHVFHVSCIDTWLGAHSSCPSCRQILVVARCQKCGGFPGSSSSGAGGAYVTDSEVGMKQGEDDDDDDNNNNNNGFLP